MMAIGLLIPPLLLVTMTQRREEPILAYSPFWIAPPSQNCEGVLTLKTAAGCEVIDGDLHIDDDDLVDGIASLPALQNITGSLKAVRLPSLTEMHFPQLAVVGKDVNIDGAYRELNTEIMVNISLPTLQRIGGKLYLEGIGPVSHVHFDALASISKSLSIRRIEVQGRIDFPVLWRVGSKMQLWFNSARFEFPLLTSVGYGRYYGQYPNPNTDGITMHYNTRALINFSALLDVHGNIKFDDNNKSSLNVPALRTIGHTFEVRGNTWTDKHTLSLPALTAIGVVPQNDDFGPGSFFLRDNTELEQLRLPTLTNISGSFEVSNNDELDNIEVPALSAIGTDRKVLNNQNLGCIDFSPAIVVSGNKSYTAC